MPKRRELRYQRRAGGFKVLSLALSLTLSNTEQGLMATGNVRVYRRLLSASWKRSRSHAECNSRVCAEAMLSTDLPTVNGVDGALGKGGVVCQRRAVEPVRCGLVIRSTRNRVCPSTVAPLVSTGKHDPLTVPSWLCAFLKRGLWGSAVLARLPDYHRANHCETSCESILNCLVDAPSSAQKER